LENWEVIKHALNSIDKNKRFACIVNEDKKICDLTTSKVTEITQLDYDDRIDKMFNLFNDTADFEFQDILFNPSDASVSINVINKSEIDCGKNDLWKFGSTTNISHNAQQFQQYFLRLVCTNGMTTKENTAYRIANSSNNIDKQFRQFMSKSSADKVIATRVNRLRESRASLYELNSVASCLKKEDRNVFFPEYQNTINEFKDKGYDVEAFNSKRQRFVYTNENLYDVFNIATNIASHRRDIVGDQVVKSLNKVAGEIFVKGPNLSFNVLDIFN